MRWHNKLVLQGNGTSEGYADVIEASTAWCSTSMNWLRKAVALERGDTVTMGPEYHGVVLVLEEMEPMTGPVEQKWWVARK